MKKRVHPIYILESIYKQLFLLLIPLLRGLLTVFTAVIYQAISVSELQLCRDILHFEHDIAQKLGVFFRCIIK